MSWLTIIWSMCAGICAMLALLHVLLWFRIRDYKYLLSAIMALSAGACALLELGMLRSLEITQYQVLLQFQNLAVYLLLMSIVWLVDLQLGTSRRWMAYLIAAMWSIGLVNNFVSPGSLVFSEITALKQHTVFWGEQFTLAQGVENPWVWLVNIATLLILVYAVDASLEAWRRLDRQSAVAFGGGIVLFLILGLVHSILVDNGILQTPYMVSFAYLAIVMAMSYDLATDAVRVSQLTREIRANELRWQELLENVQLAVVGLDKQARINFANPFFCNILGYSEQELFRQDIASLLPPGKYEEAMERLRRTEESGPRPQARWPVVCKSGERREFVWSSVRLQESDGSYAGLITVGSDITEQLNAQKALQLSQRELERLTRASLLGELASTLAHELNQPLSAILSNSQAALRIMESEPGSTSELREILEDIVRDDKRAGGVIRSLRAMLTKKEINSESFRIEDALDEVVTILQGELETNRIALHVRIDPGIAVVTARRIELQQVLVNLLLNAKQALTEMPPEGRNIKIMVTRRNGMVAISVTDNGPGIPAEQLPKIFDGFFTTGLDSMGMGLAICARIIDAHGGTITAENDPQGGAVFTFTLPA